MRITGIVATGATLLAVLTITVPSASAATAADRFPINNQNGVISGDGPNGCGFDVSYQVIKDNEFGQVKDNQGVIRVTGSLVLKFTNQSDQTKSITRNVSGPFTLSTDASGILTYTGEGLSWFGLGPGGQTNTRLPGLVFTSGRVVVMVDTTTKPDPTVLSLKHQGTLENGCQLLA